MNQALGVKSSEFFHRELVALCIALFSLAQSVLSPIPGVFWGELLLLSAAAFALVFEQNGILNIHKIHLCQIFLFLSYLTITLAAACFQPAFSLYAFVIRTVRWGAYIFCGAVLGTRVDFEKLRKYMLAIAVLAASFLILQVLVHQLTGQLLRISIGGKMLGCSLESRYVNGVYQGKVYRFSSFFSEPAHFSYYTSLALVLLLFYRSNMHFQWQELACIGIMVLAMVLSTSTYGLALLGVVGLIFGYTYLRQSRNAASAFLILMMALLVLGILFIILRNTSLYDYFLSKLNSFGSTNRSSFIWQQNRDFPPLFQWLGTGIGNEEYYFRHCFNEILPYMNSVSLSFLYCGTIGVILLVLFFLAVFACSTSNARVILCLLVVMSLFSTVFFSALTTLCTILMVSGESGPQMSLSTEERKERFV